MWPNQLLPHTCGRSRWERAQNDTSSRRRKVCAPCRALYRPTRTCTCEAGCTRKRVSRDTEPQGQLGQETGLALVALCFMPRGGGAPVLIRKLSSGRVFDNPTCVRCDRPRRCPATGQSAAALRRPKETHLGSQRRVCAERTASVRHALRPMNFRNG